MSRECGAVGIQETPQRQKIKASMMTFTSVKIAFSYS